MKKAVLIGFIMCLFIAQLASQQNSGIIPGSTYRGRTSQTPSDFISYIRFSSNNRIELWDQHEVPDENPSRRNIRTGTYSIRNRNGLDFLTVSWSSGTREEYLVLLNNSRGDIFLYTSNSIQFFGNNDSFWTGYAQIGDDSWIRASSSLRETIGGRVVVYTPERLGTRIGECWVPVNELNERLTLTISSASQLSGDELYISSGFVSFTNPNLFTDNSRMRRIRVSDNFGNSRIIVLLDTPHFQSISLSDFELNHETWTYVLTIEILDVYPGTRYRHTCVNAIYYY
ncbi:MAG: hypothetical protein FWG89_03125 [Treponema sp.]|nr:hypothetical protein [Treponema sp.]